MHGWSVTRRRLLAIAGMVTGNSALSIGKAFAQSEGEKEISDKMAADILYAEGGVDRPRGLRIRGRAQIKLFWFQKADGKRPSANWPTDNVSFDYVHLVGHPTSEEPFELTAAVLEKLVALSSLQPKAEQGKVLFGLRGCMLASGDRGQFAASQKVRDTRPNHVDAKCLIGVWDTAAKTVAIFSASTVPNVDLMEKYIEQSLGCNMLPTGLHHYRVGPHKAGSQPGAFRQQTQVWVMRSKKQLLYASNDANTIWDDLNGDLPFDNIHAAVLTSRKKPPYFSSAGCQVVAGNYDDKLTPTGPWADFRKAAGLAHPPNFVATGSRDTKDDGRRFDYMLFTGKEAQLVAKGVTDGLRVLRYGSSGDAVKELQEKLAAQPGATSIDKNGTFDRKTLGAVIRWQSEKKLAPTGLVTSEVASGLGLNWK